MNYDPAKHHRRSTRLKGYDYSASGGYFVTICTHQRECLFGKIIDGKMGLNEFGQTVAEEWERSLTMRQNIELDTSVVMPNHFHGIVKITDTVGAQCIAPLPTDKLYRQPQSLGSFVAGFKMAVTKRINTIRETPGVPVWQRNYYDRIIQDEDALHQICQYIVNNPQSWQLDQLHPNHLT
jgi:putative transposase